MLQWLNNFLRRNRPFSVKVLGRAGLRYSEGNRHMIIDGEMLVGPTAWVVYTDSITHWEAPYDAERIGAEKKLEIVENIRSTFRGWGMEIETKERQLPPPGSHLATS